MLKPTWLKYPATLVIDCPTHSNNWDQFNLINCRNNIVYAAVIAVIAIIAVYRCNTWHYGITGRGIWKWTLEQFSLISYYFSIHYLCYFAQPHPQSAIYLMVYILTLAFSIKSHLPPVLAITEEGLIWCIESTCALSLHITLCNAPIGNCSKVEQNEPAGARLSWRQ